MKYSAILKISLLAGILAFSGCGEDFLEKSAPGQLTSENFFETEEHALLATNAVYEHLRDWQVHVFSFIGLTDIISDDADKGSTPNDASFLREIDNFTFDAGNTAPTGVWSGYYQGVYRANSAIQNIPEIDMDPELRARLVGECKFLRAYYYFNLVRWFGDLPLIIEPLSPEDIRLPRDPADAVYAQIIQDLEDAVASLLLKSEYPSSELGRATKGAAKGLLAKVYLTRGDFQSAEQLALEVINSGEYGLMDNYAQIFTPDGENGIESVFEVQAAAFDPALAGSQYNEVQGVRGTPNLGWGFNRPSDDLIAAYEPGDPRREATILYPGEVLPDGSDIVQDNPNIVNERYNQKAFVPDHPGTNGNGPGNIRRLRFADIILMAAEACNENGKTDQALMYLNMIRDRARGNRPPSILPEVTETNQGVLRELIWKERRIELAMEQHRWFDLLRQGRAAEVMLAVGKENFTPGKNELLPIPQSEIDLTEGSLVQNPGW